MNDILRIARLRIALQRAFLGRAILRVILSPLAIRISFTNDFPLIVLTLLLEHWAAPCWVCYFLTTNVSSLGHSQLIILSSWSCIGRHTTAKICWQQLLGEKNVEPFSRRILPNDNDFWNFSITYNSSSLWICIVHFEISPRHPWWWLLIFFSCPGQLNRWPFESVF